MEKANLIKMLSAAGNRMRTDLQEKLLSHPAELGSDREEIIRQFLRAYLPKRFEVSTGFAFDSTGLISEQLDIIIADSNICPRFETVGGIRFYPCECIVAVGQVKSSLTSLPTLQSALNNLQSVKQLDRSAKGEAYDVRFGEFIDNKENHLHQIFTFLFIIGKSLSSNVVTDELVERVHDFDPHVWTNIVFSLDKYLITFCCDAGICPNPMDARGIAVQKESKDINMLLKFYKLLGAATDITRTSSMPYWKYLGDLGTWDAEVYYSTKDNPPPELSQIRDMFR